MPIVTAAAAAPPDAKGQAAQSPQVIQAHKRQRPVAELARVRGHQEGERIPVNPSATRHAAEKQERTIGKNGEMGRNRTMAPKSAGPLGFQRKYPLTSLGVPEARLSQKAGLLFGRRRASGCLLRRWHFQLPARETHLSQHDVQHEADDNRRHRRARHLELEVEQRAKQSVPGSDHETHDPR